MDNKAHYHKETQAAIFQGKPITLTHLTPILAAGQMEYRKREIEHQLFDVFSKYKIGREK